MEVVMSISKKFMRAAAVAPLLTALLTGGVAARATSTDRTFDACSEAAWKDYNACLVESSCWSKFLCDAAFMLDQKHCVDMGACR
jgi:hypothetical protein